MGSAGQVLNEPEPHNLAFLHSGIQKFPISGSSEVCLPGPAAICITSLYLFFEDRIWIPSSSRKPSLTYSLPLPPPSAGWVV
jgi:hypothetical protein